MKKTIFYIILMCLSSNLIQSQCMTSANTFGNNSSVTMYNVLGQVNVVLNSPTSVSVNLGTNFSTASGPDVRIFLVDRGNLTNAQLKTPAMFNSRPKIEMGMNPSSSTTYTKTIPAGMNISDFETVYFYCQAFNQFWDFGSFTPFLNANCAVLGISSLEKSNFKMYPNPVQNELTFELNATSDVFKIKIYNILGALVATKNIVSGDNAKIDVSLLVSGVYIVELQDKNNNRIVERFIKQ